jgi:hypothetical protein
MRISTRRKLALAAVSLVALLTLGVATAGAHGGPGGGERLAHASSTSALVTEAVADEDLDADRAADLKDEVPDNLRLAMALSRTRTVASNLGITTAKLNSGFRAARKALILARIDAALADGDITADRTAQLKQRLDSVELPGYKVGFGFGGRHP